jgi:hypothetical protein
LARRELYYYAPPAPRALRTDNICNPPFLPIPITRPPPITYSSFYFTPKNKNKQQKQQQQQAALRNLSDKLYEKRKTAALEVEQCTRAILHSGDAGRLRSLIDMLAVDYAGSPNANHRKGGLIGLAAVTVGLANENEASLRFIVPPVVRAVCTSPNAVGPMA